MSDWRYAVIFLRLGFLASALFAVFWGIWHLSGYQVPTYASLKLTENMSLTLPISRWWDILFAFLLVNVYAWILRVYYKFGLKFAKKDDLIVDLVFGLGVGLVFSFIVDLVFGLVVGLFFLIIVLFSFNFWKAIYNWFGAKGIA